MPELVAVARGPTARSSAGRCGYLAGEAGIRQFLDIGTGLPDRGQHPRGRAGDRPRRPDRLRRQRPDRAGPRPGPADQQPRGRAPTTSTPTCATRRRSWPRRPRDPGLRPAGRGDAAGASCTSSSTTTSRTRSSGRLIDAVPSGSYLVMSHPTREVNAAAVDRGRGEWNSSGAAPMAVRDPQQIARLLRRAGTAGAGRGHVLPVAPRTATTPPRRRSSPAWPASRSAVPRRCRLPACDERRHDRKPTLPP